MAKKITPQEVCPLCGAHPCECVQPSKAKIMKLRCATCGQHPCECEVLDDEGDPDA